MGHFTGQPSLAARAKPARLAVARSSVCLRRASHRLSQRVPRIPAASRVMRRSRACSSAFSNILAQLSERRSKSEAEKVRGAQEDGQRCRKTAAPRWPRSAHERPPPARMPGYRAGSKRLGRGEKEAEWPHFRAPHPPAIPIAPLQAAILHPEVPRDHFMPKKNNPTRSKKFDHPQDMARG